MHVVKSGYQVAKNTSKTVLHVSPFLLVQHTKPCTHQIDTTSGIGVPRC